MATNNYPDWHTSFSGILNVFRENSFQEEFKLLYEKKFVKHKDSHIRIIDTFFSDSINKETWNKIVSDSLENSIPIQMVLLNPFSEFALEREKAFKSYTRIPRMNEGLSRIIEAIKQGDGDLAEIEIMTANRKNEPIYIYEQLDKIQSLIKERKLKFTLKVAKIISFPLYMIGNYACVGQFLSTGSANAKPWLCWVNCPPKDDQFDHLYTHFDMLWSTQSDIFTSEYLQTYATDNKLYFLLPGKIKIFISHDEKKEKILNEVAKICDSYEAHPVFFEDAKKRANQPRSAIIMDKMYHECSCAIILLTIDDEFTGQNRARQNILLELGECRGRYGDENMLIMLEPGIEIPSNLKDIICNTLVKKEDGSLSVNALQISDFISKVKKNREY